METSTTIRQSSTAAQAVQGEVMGPQSQRRLSLQERGHRLAANNNNKKRKGGQLTLTGGIAFDPFLHCVICKARANNANEPHDRHHPKCWNNKRTRGKSQETLRQEKADKELQKRNTAPPKPSEKCSWRHSTVEAGISFFSPGTNAKKQQQSMENNDSKLSASFFCKEVTAKVEDNAFKEANKKKRAPLAMLAFAGIIMEKVVNVQKHEAHFDGLSITVPPCKEMHKSPHYHSIVGQKLLLVDWERMFGLSIKCKCCGDGTMVNGRTNFSKNRTLFPMFNIDGPPSWAMVKVLKCDFCGTIAHANDGDVLCRLPIHAAKPILLKLRLHYPIVSAIFPKAQLKFWTN